MGNFRKRTGSIYADVAADLAHSAAKKDPHNPKDAIGAAKPPITTVSFAVLQELGVAMAEGAMKYGRHNYRAAPVRASIYVDAAFGHIASYFEGEDIDADSNLHHITKAMASLTVLRDAIMQGKIVDDRPPKSKVIGRTDLAHHMADLQAKYPEPKSPYTEAKQP